MASSIISRNPVIRIAITHLVAKRRQTFVAMMGVTFGLAIFIFLGGLITGFQTIFIDKIVNTSANVHLYNGADNTRASLYQQYFPARADWVVVQHQKPKDLKLKIKNSNFIINEIEHDPAVEGVSPFLGGQVIFRSGSVQKAGQIAGVDIRKEDHLFNVSKYMIAGEVLKLETTSNGVILGSGLAEDLGVQVNDLVTLVSQEGISLDLKVVGIHESGLVTVDKSRAFVKLITAQKLLNKEGSYITDINIKVKDIEQAEALAKLYGAKYGYQAHHWKQDNEAAFSVFKVQNMVMYLVIVSILVVSGFGIFNIQMMIIHDKMGDIAILKALGYKDRDVRRIFLAESLVIGVIGGLLGLLLGFILTEIISRIPMNVNSIVSLKYLPFNKEPLFYVVAFVFGLIATGIAGYLPARKAAKIDPVDIIRGK